MYIHTSSHTYLRLLYSYSFILQVHALVLTSLFIIHQKISVLTLTHYPFLGFKHVNFIDPLSRQVETILYLVDNNLFNNFFYFSKNLFLPGNKFQGQRQNSIPPLCIFMYISFTFAIFETMSNKQCTVFAIHFRYSTFVIIIIKHIR